jgi:cytochrome c553
MRRMKLVLPAAVLAAGFLFCTTATYGKAEYAKKEKKACTFCHAKAGTDKEVMNNNLTDAGKYYKAHDHSLDGFTK